MQLNQKNLSALHGSLKVPDYNRQSLKSGIVHVGVGGFHRAHQAVAVQELLSSGGNQNWGICGIGLREEDRRISEVFKNQDCLYSLIVRSPNGQIETEVMGQMTDFLLAPENKKVVIERMANPETKIVSMTITEGGYNLKSDGEFDLAHPDIQHDLKNLDDPKTIYGYLYSALQKRKTNGHPPFTIMSCDNIQHNGDVTQKMLLAFVSQLDIEFAEWIKKEVPFPNSMVDRITPSTTPLDTKYLSESFNLQDEWPVTCEPFLQWVIEDNFSDGRPDFDKVDGVQFVSDVTPYEKMKIRLLNAGHSVLGILGALQGIETINACLANESLANFLSKFWDLEATPILDDVEGIDLVHYKASLLERFANPNIKDKVSRICSESSAKIPNFLLSTIEENLKLGGSIKLATTIVAAWCYYSDKQVGINGQAIEIIDNMSGKLHEAAENTSIDALSFLKLEEVFGDLISNSKFTEEYVKTVNQIYKDPSCFMKLN